MQTRRGDGRARCRDACARLPRLSTARVVPSGCYGAREDLAGGAPARLGGDSSAAGACRVFHNSVPPSKQNRLAASS